MKQTLAMFACLLTAAGFISGIARAGVVIDEQVTTTQGNAPAVTHSRELMVQGHKEKMVSDRNMFVIDLDKGTMMLIDPNQKAYAEMPFPPHGMSNNPAQQLLRRSIARRGPPWRASANSNLGKRLAHQSEQNSEHLCH